MSLQDRLDPDVASTVAMIPFDHITAELLPTLRVSFDRPDSATVTRTDHVVEGEEPLTVRVHRPVDGSGLLPCVYSMHGGGYVIGSYTFDDDVFEHLCPTLGVVGVSVEYRLAPETPYPGPLEDCYRGLQWTHVHAEELGVDRTRIGVMGSSAGGGLAAALALLCRERNGPEVAFQVLDSPMLDDRQITDSSRQHGLPVWSRESTEFGWRCYLGELSGRDDVPPTAAPARATDLAGLPPAFVGVGAVDGFLDEDLDYARRMVAAGVPVDVHVYAGACHGFQAIAADSVVARRFRRDLEEWLAARIR